MKCQSSRPTSPASSSQPSTSSCSSQPTTSSIRRGSNLALSSVSYPLPRSGLHDPGSPCQTADQRPYLLFLLGNLHLFFGLLFHAQWGQQICQSLVSPQLNIYGQFDMRLRSLHFGCSWDCAELDLHSGRVYQGISV